MPTDNESAAHMLRIFAFHIHTLATAKPKDKFSLSFWGGVKVQVEVDAIQDEGAFKLNGGWVGNVHGAIQKYAELCAPAFEEKK